MSHEVLKFIAAGYSFPSLALRNRVCRLSHRFVIDARLLQHAKKLKPRLKKTTEITTSKMSAIGSLVFCTDCGNLLDSSSGNQNTILVCDCCGAENKGTFALISAMFKTSF
jgi:hypothetical protein